MQQINHTRGGTTLLEVIFTIAVIGMVLGALITAVNYGLSNAQYARNKALATKYGQEAVEWLREQRNLNWYELYDNKSCPSSVGCVSYCLPDLSTLVDFSYWPSPVACSAGAVITDQFLLFHREMILVRDGTDKITVQVRVFWQQGNRDSEITLNTYLTRWQ